MSKKEDPQSVSNVVEIPLSEIFVDTDWNSRLKLDGGSGGPDPAHEQSIDELAASILVEGQITPVLVRPNKGVVHSDGKTTNHPYILVCGHRRYAAIQKNVGSLDGEKHTIRAEVKDLDDVKAREYNLLENTGRHDLNPADTAYGIQEYLKVNPNATQATIAAFLGKNQGYVSRLLTIATKTQPGVFNDWRKSGCKLPVLDMVEIAKMPKADQRKAYDAMTVEEEAGDEKASKAKFLASLKEKAARMGAFFYDLEVAGYLKTSEKMFADTAMPDVLGIKKELTPHQLGSVVDAFTDGYNSRETELQEAANEEKEREAKNKAEKEKAAAQREAAKKEKAAAKAKVKTANGAATAN